ncbi:hypothetical protein GS456_18860 [Rhodococcus hoagii]|nr:hypothetical protein [Prescottella equi]
MAPLTATPTTTYDVSDVGTRGLNAALQSTAPPATVTVVEPAGAHALACGLDAPIDVRIDECGDYFPQRDDALRAHATQIDPNGSFFAVPLDIQQKIWPTEEFELAKTRVHTAIPENDLFAGIVKDEKQ